MRPVRALFALCLFAAAPAPALALDMASWEAIAKSLQSASSTIEKLARKVEALERENAALRERLEALSAPDPRDEAARWPQGALMLFTTPCAELGAEWAAYAARPEIAQEEAEPLYLCQRAESE